MGPSPRFIRGRLRQGAMGSVAGGMGGTGGAKLPLSEGLTLTPSGAKGGSTTSPAAIMDASDVP